MMLNKILIKYPVLSQSDKLQHFIVGHMATQFFAVLGFSILYSFLFGFFLGILKEITDYTTKKGTPDIVDFYATALGALFGALFVGGIAIR